MRYWYTHLDNDDIGNELDTYHIMEGSVLICEGLTYNQSQMFCSKHNELVDKFREIKEFYDNICRTI